MCPFLSYPHFPQLLFVWCKSTYASLILGRRLCLWYADSWWHVKAGIDGLLWARQFTPLYPLCRLSAAASAFTIIRILLSKGPFWHISHSSNVLKYVTSKYVNIRCKLWNWWGNVLELKQLRGFWSCQAMAIKINNVNHLERLFSSQLITLLQCGPHCEEK